MIPFNRQRDPNIRRSGFTLVELLLVMAIIAVLSSLALVVIAGAQDDARRSATQSRISVIHNLLMQRMENYEFMKLPIDTRELVFGNNSEDSTELINARQLKRRIVLDVISSEMPRSYNQLAIKLLTVDMANANNQTATFPSSRLVEWMRSQERGFFNRPVEMVIGIVASNRTASAERFLKFDSQGAIANPEVYPEGIADPDLQTPEQRNRSSSEYLYMILESSNDIGVSGVEVIGNGAIADTDDDGFPEIVDSWGNPIGFAFEMYDDNGELVVGTETDLDSGYDLGIPVANIRLVLISSGNGDEPITN